MKKNSEKNMGQLTGEIFALLENHEKESASKILTSVATLLGISSLPGTSPLGGGSTPPGSGEVTPGTGKFHSTDAKAFFEAKKPKTIGEIFAVAAKFRADNGLGDVHSKDDFKDIIKNKAKRTFSDKNFGRDIDNAIRQAKFFISSDQKGHYLLSSTGEDFVEALPDRAAANQTRKANKPIRRAKKKAAKKTSKK